MNRFSAHIGYLYSELHFRDRIAAAARDGFTAIEHPEPFDVPASEMRDRIADFGLTFTQLSSGFGDPTKGEKGLAALRGRELDFRLGFQRALDYAHAISCPFVHPMAGVPKGGWVDAGETYRANIGWAVEACKGSDVSVLVEAITVPGYYLGSLSHAIELQDSFAGRIALLFDTYHAANLIVDPAEWILGNSDRIGHVHIADHPGRNEPGTGTIDFSTVLNALKAVGYRGALGFEYIPSASTTKSIAFISEWKRIAALASTSRFHAGANS